MTEELIDAYEEYIKLLGDEISDLMVLAISHGWQSKRVEQGEAARKKIVTLKTEMELKKESLIEKLKKEINPVCSCCGEIATSGWKECGCQTEGRNEGLHKAIKIIYES